MYCEDGGLGCVVCGTYVKYTYWAANPGRAMLMFTHGSVESPAPARHRASPPPGSLLPFLPQPVLCMSPRTAPCIPCARRDRDRVAGDAVHSARS